MVKIYAEYINLHLGPKQTKWPHLVWNTLLRSRSSHGLLVIPKIIFLLNTMELLSRSCYLELAMPCCLHLLEIIVHEKKCVFNNSWHHVGMPLLTRCHWQCLDRLSQIFAPLCKVCFYGRFSIENEFNAGNFCPGLIHWVLLLVQFVFF